MSDKEKKCGITAFTLHILAMGFMVCDHAWATVISGHAWLSSLGRIAFPIFAFLLAEGFRRTKSVKRYALRLLTLAVITEVPFDLMSSGTVFYPFHQNVIFTFLLALLCMQLIAAAMQKKQPVLTFAVSAAVALAGWFLGRVLMVDYGGEGVLMVLVFFLFPGKTIWQKLCQLLAMAYLNCVLLASYVVPVSLFGYTMELPEQGLALLALLPIWLYHGEQGYHSRWMRIFCYAFYPAHMLFFALWMLHR